MSDIPVLTNYSAVYFFEIPQELNPCLPQLEKISKTDSNHGIDQGWIKLCLNNMIAGEYGVKTLPRIMWIMKQWTLKDLHH